VLLFAIGIRRRWNERMPGERFLLGLYGALSVAFALVPGLDAGRVWLPWSALSLGVGTYAAWRLLLDAWHGRARGLALAGLAAVAAVVLDRVLTRLGVTLAVGPSLSSLVPVLFLLGFGGSLLATLLHALRESEALNRTLDARIAARESALRASERERALAEERNRLMRDVHDGTGGKLVTALSLVRSGRATPAALEDTLADALDDLNLTIHSLRPDSTDLPGVLGLLRARLERQTRAHGVRLAWAIGDAGEGIALSPEGAMHVIRIVQEAVSNALRHAGAATVRIASGGDEGRIWFEVSDDGRGGAAPREGGRGLANLRHRAERLGGELALHSEPDGTRVRVVLAGPHARVSSESTTPPHPARA
jgi:signal transduction histidine kinase